MLDRRLRVLIDQVTALHEIAVADVDHKLIDEAISAMIERCHDAPFDDRAVTILSILVIFRTWKQQKPASKARK